MSAWQSILLDAALKSALVLALAWLSVTLMRKTSAAARHLVWFLAVAALPLLPVLSWALPGWHVLPGWMEMQPRATEALPQATQVLAAPVPVVASEMAVEAPPVVKPMPLSASPELPPIDRPALTPKPPKPTRQTTVAVLDFSRRALSAWLGVALLALAPAFLGMMSLWRLEWGARRENEPRWLQLLQRLVERLGIRRRVRLLKTERRRMPMTWGVIQPRLLLPEESRDWPEERRRVVMLHELAHAKRLDYLTNLVTQFACALYWFNPLVWLAARRMAAERERACDDIVLNHGAKPADYAEQVLQIAAGLPVTRFTALDGIPMARQSGLEGRLRAILDSTRNRAALSRVVMLAMLAALAVVVVPVAMLKAAAPASGRSAATVTTNGDANQVYRDPWGNPYLITMDMRDGAAPSNNAPTAPASRVGTTSTNRLEFLPEVERVLDTRGALGGRAYLSFTNGIVTEETSAENPQRNRQLHRDLKLQTIEGEQEWTGVDLQVAPATEDMWNTPADQLVSALADNLAPPLPTMQVTPGIWFFKTRDGTYGLLRVVGFVEPRPGYQAMKVVYKLTKPVSEQKRASMDLFLPERIRQFLAGEPATTGSSLEIWEQDSVGGTALRKDLVTMEIHDVGDLHGTQIFGHVHYLKSANRFYIQWEGGIGASTLHYYGPFEGDPVKVLGLPGRNGAAGDWGETKDGIAVGLAATKTVWSTSEKPELTAWVRNHGTNAADVTSPQEQAELEVDGVVYNQRYAYNIVIPPSTTPQQPDRFRVNLADEWGTVATSAAGFGPVNLATGKHTVRLAVIWGAGQDSIRAVSNPLEIEITDVPLRSSQGDTTRAGSSQP